MFKQPREANAPPSPELHQSAVLDDVSETPRRRFDGVRRVAQTAKSEIAQSPHRKRTLLAGAQLMISQGLDRARFAILVIPPAVVSTMEQTNNSLVAGAVGAGMFLGWGAAVGESTLQGLDAYPESVEVFEEEHPKFVNFFADALPGVQSGGPSSETFTEPTVVENIGTRARRAGSSLSLGTSPYVATAKATGYDNAEARRLYADTSVDGAGAVFVLAAGMTEGIKRLAIEGHYELAQDIQNVVENNKFWWALAGLSIGSELVSNKLKSRKQARNGNTIDGSSIDEESIWTD